MIDALIAHLASETSSFEKITHAKSQEPVDDAELELPLLGVFPGPDSAGEDGTDFVESKMITTVVLVHLVCKIEDLETLRTELRTAAIGWSASAYHTDLGLVSGELLKLTAGIAWWEEKYAARHVIREVY